MKKGKSITDNQADSGILGSEQTFYHNTLVRFALLIAFSLQFLGFALLIFLMRTQNSIVIVHYNVYFGVDLIGDRWQSFLVPTITFLFAVMNTLLAQWFYEQKERIASYVLLLTSIFLSLGSVLACVSITFINY